MIAGRLGAWLALLLGSTVAMEPISAAIHRHIGHGVAWPLHRSHHEGPVRGPELNDLIPLASALATVALIAAGMWAERLWWVVPVGAGFTLYGLAYVVVHDLYTHRRLPLLPVHIGVLEPFRRAHLEHHRTGDGAWGLFGCALSGRGSPRPLPARDRG